MAAGSKLVLTFEAGDGSPFVHVYNYADPEATAADVKALVNGIIANGSIFARIPVTAKSAEIVSMTEKEISLS